MNKYEEYAKENCKDCKKQCNKGITERIDGSVHCADED